MSDPGRQRPDNRERARETQGELREAEGGTDRSRESRTSSGGQGGHKDPCEEIAQDVWERQACGEECGGPAEAAGQPPTFPARMRMEGLPSSLLGPDVDGGRSQLWAPRPTGKAAPTHPRSSRDPGLGSQARLSTEPVLPAGAWLACAALPVVVATGHCQGNQRGSHPAGAEPGVALGNPVRWFPHLPLPTSGSGPGEGQGKSRRQRDSCGGLRRRGRPFKMELGPGTQCQRAAFVVEDETTTPSMPRGGWPPPPRPVAQEADGSWSSLLLGGLNGGTGWAWGARALGCLRRKDHRTPPPCFRSPQPRGLQLATRFRTQAESASALVSQTRCRGGGKARLGLPGAGFGWVY